MPTLVVGMQKAAETMALMVLASMATTSVVMAPGVRPRERRGSDVEKAVGGKQKLTGTRRDHRRRTAPCRL